VVDLNCQSEIVNPVMGSCIICFGASCICPDYVIHGISNFFLKYRKLHVAGCGYLLGVEMFVQLQKVSSQGSKISILCWDVDDRDNQCQGWTVRV